MFLADNPTTLVANITAAQLIPYLPNQATAIPTVKALTGVTMTIRVNVNPPNINNGSGGIYDPSGSSNDSLWDVGL
jgi:predicted lipoprotein